MRGEGGVAMAKAAERFRVVVLEHGYHQRRKHDWVLASELTEREAEARANRFNRGNASDPDHGTFGGHAVVEPIETAAAGPA